MLEAAGDAAARMDAVYGIQRHIYDASRKYYLLGRDRLLDGLEPPPGASVLEVGCGTGRNLILAARRYPGARLFGFDISAMMLETAARSVARKGLADRISLARGDAARFSGAALFGMPEFDRVFISYALSMIPPWREAVRQALRAVAPGGSLHVVDFGGQSELPRWFRGGLAAWLRQFSVEPRADLEAELGATAEAIGARVSFERLYRDYARHIVLERP